MGMKRYTHSYLLGFTVETDNPDIAEPEELRKALCARINRDIEGVAASRGAGGVVMYVGLGDPLWEVVGMPVEVEEKPSLTACATCGCTDVEVTAWVKANRDEVTDDHGGEKWCPQCVTHEIDLVVRYEEKPYNPESVK